MSRSRIDLKDKRVAAVVMALLVTVIIVNVRTFLPDLKKVARRDFSVEEELPLPSDLDEATRIAASRLASMRSSGGTDLAGLFTEGQSQSVARPVRDPFRPGSAPKPKSVKQGRKPRSTQSAPRQKLTCEAVLMGSSRPTAFINGKPYHVGNQVGSYRIDRIDRHGVLLHGVDKDVFLPVCSQDDEGAYYPLVTGPK
jgi:hypothetical protein